MTDLDELKAKVTHAHAIVDRHWDKFDADPDEKKAYPNVFMWGAACRLISEQKAYIEALEAQLAEREVTS
jgi:hypothetical protein